MLKFVDTAVAHVFKELYFRETGESLGEEVHRDVPEIEQRAPLDRAARRVLGRTRVGQPGLRRREGLDIARVVIPGRDAVHPAAVLRLEGLSDCGQCSLVPRERQSLRSGSGPDTGETEGHCTRRGAATMGQSAGGGHRSLVVKTYGRWSLLGLLSLPFALLMASRGMNGWQESAARDMADDAVAMARKGYRVVASGEHGIPRLGIAYHRVTYQLAERA